MAETYVTISEDTVQNVKVSETPVKVEEGFSSYEISVAVSVATSAVEASTSTADSVVYSAALYYTDELYGLVSSVETSINLRIEALEP
jgi:hypothetical protein